MIRLVDLCDSDALTQDVKRSPQWRFISNLVDRGTSAYISNIDARVRALITNGGVHPIVEGSSGETSYLCSVTRLVFDGAAAEFSKSRSPLLRTLTPAVRGASRLGRLVNLDNVVWVDQFLLGTGPASDWSACDIETMTELLIAEYPKHAICIGEPA
jgi:hypothetical protein